MRDSRWKTTQEVLRRYGFRDRRLLYRLAKDGRIPRPKRLTHRTALWDVDAIDRAIETSPVVSGTEAAKRKSPAPGDEANAEDCAADHGTDKNEPAGPAEK